MPSPFCFHCHPINLKKAASLITVMSWTCSKCTYSNPSSQKLQCQICLSAPPQSLLSSLTISAPTKPKWSCARCTYLNPFRSTTCEMCGFRVSSSLLSTLEVDDDDLNGPLGSSIGSVFLPLKTCNSNKRGNGANPSAGNNDTSCSGKLKYPISSLPRGDTGYLVKEKRDFFSTGFSNEHESGRDIVSVLRPCSNKRKDRVDNSLFEAGGSSGSRAMDTANKAIEIESLAAPAANKNHLGSELKTWKILSYNVWFREDLEMHKRMAALGKLIELHSPDFICLQEVTPSFYHIFQQSNWWKGYNCSLLDGMEFPGGYFCIQLSKMPVKSFRSKPFHNSIMGRELCVAEVEVLPEVAIVVATSHLESPCPAPPKWDQMFSKERVHQAKEAVEFLGKNKNVIFCGDMNWDDKLDGPFPLGDAWIDAWTDLRPGEVGWTYDTKANKMLSGNRALQKRLDRFVCKLKDFKFSKIEMIGMDAIQGLSYTKEKRVKNEVKELLIPVLPSDHFGLLLTISSSSSQ